MPEEPQIIGLSKGHRLQFFWLLVVVFMVSLPVLIFYTTGYRLTFENDQTTIVTTGGVYVTTNDLEVDVYLDEEKVEKPRLFRSAYYIQNIETGIHRLVVQRPDLQTWVKELPVDPHIVIEASAFNMPAVPHIRPITEYLDGSGRPVYFTLASSSSLFPQATTTVLIVTATSTSARVFYDLNEEFIFVQSLFSTSSSESVFDRLRDQMERFRFSTTSATVSTTTDFEPVVENGNIRIEEQAGELYAVWYGPAQSIPYYFCVTERSSSSIAERYGTHVAAAIEKHTVSTTSPLLTNQDRLCRPEIKLDRKRMDVYFYDFFPGTADLVLLQLEDGLYVTEIDDRSWQNTQLLYPGANLQVALDSNSIFVKEQNRYFEIITEIEPN